jgi:hypothetical protein
MKARERVPRNVGDVWLVNQKSKFKSELRLKISANKNDFSIGLGREKNSKRLFVFGF